MRKLLLIPLVIVLVTALIFGGCKPAEEVPEEIRVGCSISLTGIYAGFSTGGAWGSQAAIDDINKLGGVYVAEYGKKLPVKFILVDNESDATKAGTLAEDLIVRDNVHALIAGGVPQDLATPISTVAERYKLPYLLSGGLKEQFFAIRESVSPPWEYTWDMSFAVIMPYPPGSIWDKPGYTVADVFGAYLNDILTRTNGKAGVFADDTVDGRGWFELFPAMAEGMGVEIHGGLFPIGNTDYSSLINEWKANDCEILMGNATGVDGGVILRQCREMGLKPKTIFLGKGGLFYEDASAWGGDLPNGVVVDSPWYHTFDPEMNPGIGGTTPMSLYERWHEDTGKPANLAIGFGYYNVQVLIDAIERAGSLDPDKINEAIGETNIATVYGPIVFDKENHFAGTVIALAQWQETDKPWVWEKPLVYALQDFQGPTAELLFPIPYD